MILSCKDLHKAYGTDVILEKVSFSIEDREKTAIVGVNGAGKSTLFKLITGDIALDGGEIHLRKDASFGYLAQNSRIESGKAIYDEMLSVFDAIIAMETRLREMEREMASLTGSALASFMEQYAKLQHEFEQQDGYGFKSRIRGILKGLGFTEEEFEKPVEFLSGGQKTRVFLAKLLLTQPDLLLLDEPTNHLDIASLQWLEDFIRSYPKAVILISHDRYFMDATVEKIIEIENKKSTVYQGSYTHFAKQKETNREIARHQFTQQQKEIKRQEDIIRELRSFNREKFVKRAESRQKQLEKIELVERPEALPDKMRLSLTPRITSGNDVLYAQNLSKSFGSRKLFQNVAIDIKKGEHVAIIGPNGVGKSTLFKILLGQVSPDSGEIRFGTNVHTGYYDQEQQRLADEKNILEEISDTYPTMKTGEIRNVLAAFVFTGDDIYKTISSLSGGEKGRVSLAKIMLSQSNFLMLDEPTNHLDMFSKEILEDALNSYDGTVLYVSHDRYFINKTAHRMIDLTTDGAVQYLGNYSYYLEKKKEQQWLAAEEQKENAADAKAEKESGLKTDWLKQKEEQAKERRVHNQLKKFEREIEQTEQEISRIDTLLFTEEVSTDAAKAAALFQEKTKLEAQLEMLYEKWGDLQA